MTNSSKTNKAPAAAPAGNSDADAEAKPPFTHNLTEQKIAEVLHRTRDLLLAMLLPAC